MGLPCCRLLGKARSLWMSYQPQEERTAFEREWRCWVTLPFAYHLGDVEKKTLETIVGYLQKETLICRGFGLDELFYGRL